MSPPTDRRRGYPAATSGAVGLRTSSTVEQPELAPAPLGRHRVVPLDLVSARHPRSKTRSEPEPIHWGLTRPNGAPLQRRC